MNVKNRLGCIDGDWRRALVASLIALGLGFFVSAGHSAAPAEDNPVIFEVADSALRLHDLRAFVAKRPHYRANIATRAGLNELVYEMLDAKLFRMEGERLGIQPPPGVKLEDDGYYFTVQYASIERCVAPDEVALKAFYDANTFLFSTPALVRVSRVIAPASVTIDGLSAEAFLRNAAIDVGADPARFEALVSKVSAALPVSAGVEIRQGDLGFQQVPPVEHLANDFERKLLKAVVGEVIGPIVTGESVVLVKISDRREPVITPWPQAREDVSRTMLRACGDEKRWKKRRELYERYQVVVHEDVIRALEPSMPGQ